MKFRILAVVAAVPGEVDKDCGPCVAGAAVAGLREGPVELVGRDAGVDGCRGAGDCSASEGTVGVGTFGVGIVM